MNSATLASLREAGADRHDPVRLRYLEALAERLPHQPPAVQQVLAQRLQLAVAAYAEQVGAQRAAVAQPVTASSDASAPMPIPTPTSASTSAPSQPAAPQPLSPLAQLNQELAERAQAEVDRLRIEGGASASHMKSVREFSEVWSRIAAEQQVAQALDRGPENAGPLNPHKLMLRSIRLMRGLSPDYLRRFLSQMDSLLWLDQAHHRPRAPLRPGKARAKG